MGEVDRFVGGVLHVSGNKQNLRRGGFRSEEGAIGLGIYGKDMLSKYIQSSSDIQPEYWFDVPQETPILRFPVITSCW